MGRFQKGKESDRHDVFNLKLRSLSGDIYQTNKVLPCVSGHLY